MPIKYIDYTIICTVPNANGIVREQLAVIVTRFFLLFEFDRIIKAFKNLIVNK